MDKDEEKKEARLWAVIVTLYKLQSYFFTIVERPRNVNVER